ncbi:MAG: hypothetical protein KI785_10505 [Devosiaceae bacterium]|nr:hypothetical protein [Devosiaceae bacterium MH13]
MWLAIALSLWILLILALCLFVAGATGDDVDDMEPEASTNGRAGDQTNAAAEPIRKQALAGSPTTHL